MQERAAIEGADVRAPSRVTRADRYLKEHLGGQQDWYDRKASRYKNYAQWLSLTIIMAGGLTAFVQMFSGVTGTANLPPWPAMVTALLALTVVVGEGLARIGRYRETWVGYRKASEQIKREYRLYVNNAGGYEKIADEEAAYRHFVEAIEQIIAEEQQLYWQSPASKDGSNSGSQRVDDGK